MHIIWSLLLSFILTIFLEGIVVIIFGFREKKCFQLFFLVNLLTNPAVVFACYVGARAWAGFGLGQQLVMEIAVVVIEAYIYYLFSKKEGWTIKHPLVMSLVANSFSYGVGLLIGMILK